MHAPPCLQSSIIQPDTGWMVLASRDRHSPTSFQIDDVSKPKATAALGMRKLSRPTRTDRAVSLRQAYSEEGGDELITACLVPTQSINGVNTDPDTALTAEKQNKEKTKTAKQTMESL